MSGKNTCCDGGDALIFACSGAADVGEIADKAARKAAAEGNGAMFCMAGIGGGVEPILQRTRQASIIVALDGCPLDCVAKSLEKAGFSKFERLRVTDSGFEKGASPATDEAVAEIAEKVADTIENASDRNA